jgi:hypothetical protein
MLISVIATLISSIALVGVAVGLILQARQLRISQIQAVRSLNLELIKVAIDNPTLMPTATGMRIDPSERDRAAFLNLQMTQMYVGYSLKVMPKGSIIYSAQRIFETEFARAWWEFARKSYEVSSRTKREREFVTLVDAEFQRTTKNQAGSAADAQARP